MTGRDTHRVTSPDGHVSVTFGISEKGNIFYRVDRGEKRCCPWSRLGLKLKDVPDMITGFSVDSIRYNAVFGIVESRMGRRIGH